MRAGIPMRLTGGRQMTRETIDGRATVCLAAAAVFLLAAAMARAGDGGMRSFVAERNGITLSQAPDWIDRDTVVWHGAIPEDEGGDGQVQIVTSDLNGVGLRCLTCGLAGPNQVPVAQPRGDWVLFHSWNGHGVTIGSAGFGGIGSDLWVVRKDGTQRTNLTRSAEFHDNFHAYWSPNGRYIVWTALNWNQQEGGNGRSDIRVARFDPEGPGGPRLVDEHVVRPGNGHWYETQWWAPDGSGFLYTETVDTAINPELFFCRLPDPGRGMCHPVRLTRDPAWDEQAIFSDDMNRVIFMSSRNLPGAHNDWATLATLLGLPAEYDYQLILPVFTESYLQPVFQQATDLYQITLRWNRGRTRFKPGPITRLTTSGEAGWVIPEFAFDPRRRRLLWTQNKFGDGHRVDQSCIVRQIRAAIVDRLSSTQTILQVPFDLPDQIRDQAVDLLRAPSAFSFHGRGCGGDAAGPPALVQETRIGRYAE